MLFPINRKNFAKSLYATMLGAASIHLVISLLTAILNNEPDRANMFTILGISLLIPELGQGALNNLLGITLVIAIGIGAYIINQHHARKHATKTEKKLSSSTE